MLKFTKFAIGIGGVVALAALPTYASADQITALGPALKRAVLPSAMAI